MKSKRPLPQDKKLTVIFRVESGCLGPEGDSHISEFCQFAQKEVAPIDSDFVIWNILPRDDRTLPEMQYQVNNKKLTRDKAEKYLQVFEKKLDDFESHLHEKLDHLIEQYMNH